MEYPFKDLLPLDEVLAREGYYKDWTHLDPEVFYSLTQISEYIKTKGYGVDVRLLIAQLAEHFGLKTTQVVDLANLLQQQFTNLEGVTQSFTNNINSLVAQMEADKNTIVANATVDSEVILARGGKPTLQARLDETAAQLAEIEIEVEMFGAIGDGVTDDSQAFIDAFDYITTNHLTLKTRKNKTYIVDNIIVENKEFFNFKSEGILKRPDNLSTPHVPGLASGTLTFKGCKHFNIETIYLDGNHLNQNVSVDGDYGAPFQPSHRHGLLIIDCQHFNIGKVFSLNALGDGIYITGHDTFDGEINHVTATSIDESGDYIALGRNPITICNGKLIKVGTLIVLGVGHSTQPGGFDIEPNNGEKVENVSVDHLHLECSGMNPLGIVSKYGNGEDIKNIEIGSVYIKTDIVDRSIRSLIVGGATNVHINSVTIDGTDDTQAVHVGIAGTGMPVYNLNIDEVNINKCRYGLVADNLYNSTIKIKANECTENFMRLYSLDNVKFNVTGNFSTSSTGELMCIFHNPSSTWNNVTISGDLSKETVGNNATRLLNSGNNNPDTELITNCKLQNLACDGWWVASGRIISGLVFHNLSKENCSGLTSASLPSGIVRVYSVFKTGDVIKNDSPVELGDVGEKYIIESYIVTQGGSNDTASQTFVENRIKTGN